MSGVAKKLMSSSGGVAGGPVMIEDVFSTYLYTGNSSTQTITNGIDLAGEGGLVWIKTRNGTVNHYLYDTERGATKELSSNNNGAEANASDALTSFNPDGFSLGADNGTNKTSNTYASWTFRKAPRFFDVVTYTGNGVAGLEITHNLGVDPGFIVVKKVSDTGNWRVFHRSFPDYFGNLDVTSAFFSGAAPIWGDGSVYVAPTSTNFTVGSDHTVNSIGQTYVAYLFAHDPLGPSGDGSDGLIACGSYTGNGSADGPEIDLGWEPQWVLVKIAVGNTGDWKIFDTMRGIATGGTTVLLEPNTSDAELINNDIDVAATGFKVVNSNSRINQSGATFIYIAIRRGPMRAPTSGTEVFAMDNGGGGGFASGFPVDSAWTKNKDSAVGWKWYDRLRGHGSYLRSNLPSAETGASTGTSFASNTEFDYGLGADNIGYIFRRAPEFFDVVTYTGNGGSDTKTHGLGVVPEMMIVKARNVGREWNVYHVAAGNTKSTVLNTTAVPVTKSGYWNNTTPTTSVFSVSSETNRSGDTMIAYLFATLAGVSKVGSYTGNGSSQTIDCGFTTGARLVLIKATSTTGDWLIADTARGIVAGNDPYLELNTTNAEVTSEDWLDPDSSGFVVNEVAGSNANTSGVSYIFYAVA